MKKTKLMLIIATGLIAISCSKEYTFECETTTVIPPIGSNPAEISTVKNSRTIKGKKDDARAECEVETTYAIGDSGTQGVYSTIIESCKLVE